MWLDVCSILWCGFTFLLLPLVAEVSHFLRNENALGRIHSIHFFLARALLFRSPAADASLYCVRGLQYIPTVYTLNDSKYARIYCSVVTEKDTFNTRRRHASNANVVGVYLDRKLK